MFVDRGDHRGADPADPKAEDRDREGGVRGQGRLGQPGEPEDHVRRGLIAGFICIPCRLYTSLYLHVLTLLSSVACRRFLEQAV